MQKFANPARFNRLANAFLPWLMGLGAVAFVVGLYFALIGSPPDYQQGETVRIMYLHVPSAYLAVAGWVGLTIAAILSLIWRHPLADIAGEAIAPVGALFTALALITGSLWGKPMWGTWWVWDARLTSVLVLFFLYLGYMAIWQLVDDKARAARLAAIVAIVGAVDLPLIKYSVEYWNTLHQPASLFRAGGPTIDTSMLIPLAIMFVATKLFFITVILWRMKALLAARKIRALSFEQARGV